MERPFPAYKGDAPYVFVSYAHEDAEIVFPEIRWLQQEEFNVWWDDGINPGSRWSDEIARSLEGSALLLYFCTPLSINSRHCLDEINLALDADRPMITIHLEDADLTPGLRLRLSSHQAVLRHELDEKSYRSKLISGIEEHLRPALALSQASTGNTVDATTSPKENSVAILPFVNMSSDAEQEYFADGITEDLIDRLTRQSALRVIARTSCFYFKKID